MKHLEINISLTDVFCELMLSGLFYKLSNKASHYSGMRLINEINETIVLYEIMSVTMLRKTTSNKLII